MEIVKIWVYFVEIKQSISITKAKYLDWNCVEEEELKGQLGVVGLKL